MAGQDRRVARPVGLRRSGLLDMIEDRSARAERHLWDSLILSAENCLRNKSHLKITSRDIAEGAGTHLSMSL
jgi:hypothetical protein